MEGYNATVLAYGQTGSGKTYTMGTAFAGNGDACPMGVVPRVLEDAFEAISEKASNTHCTLTMTYLEIYNEHVHDLLHEGSGSEPRHMFYKDDFGNYEVKGLTETPLQDLSDLCSALTAGARRRTTASTQMNAVSSRSHAVITLKLVQRPASGEEAPPASPADSAAAGAPSTPTKDTAGEDDEGDMQDSVVRTSLFRLVDLAGSERAKKTGAEGDRLREANNINQSLTTLGLCITALATKARHVPFRNSKLTQLLTNSLGGNSSTCMIACVSPADSNYEETMLTLRYADAASSIENKPVVNADPIGATNVHLRSTIHVLKTELSRLYAEGANVSPAILQRFQLGGAVAPFGSPTPCRGAGPRAPLAVPPPSVPDARPITGTGAGMAYAADESEELHALKVRLRELEADLQVAGAELATTQSALTMQSRQGEEMYALASALTTQHVAALTAADKWRWRFEKVTSKLSAPFPGTDDATDGEAATTALAQDKQAAAAAAAELAAEDADGDAQLDVDDSAGERLPVVDQGVALSSASAGDTASSKFASDVPVMRLFAEKNSAIALLQAQLVRALAAQQPGASDSGIAGLMLAANAGVAALHGASADGEDADEEDTELDGDTVAADAAAAAVHAAACAPGEEEVAAMATHLHMASELASLHDAIAAKERLFKATEQSVGVQLTEYEALKAKFKGELEKQEEEMQVLQTKLQLLSAELEEVKATGGTKASGGGDATPGVKAKDSQIKSLRSKIAHLEKSIDSSKREAARRDREAARLVALKDGIESAKRERVELEKRMREAAKAHAAERRVRAREAAQMAKVRRTDQLRIAKQAAQLQKQAAVIDTSRQRERLARSKEAELLRKQAAAARMRAARTPLGESLAAVDAGTAAAPAAAVGVIRRRPVSTRRAAATAGLRSKAAVASADLGSVGGRRRAAEHESLGDLLGDTSALDAATTALLQEAVATVAQEAASGTAAEAAALPSHAVPGTPSTLTALRTSRTLPEDVQEMVAKVLAFRCRKAAWKALREEAAEERTALAQRVTSALEGGAAEEDVDSLKRRVVALTHRMSHANQQWATVGAQEEALGLAANQWMAAVAASAAKGGRRAQANLAGRLINWLLSMLIHAQLALHEHEVQGGQDKAQAGVVAAAGGSTAAAARRLETEHAVALHDAYEQVSSLRKQLAQVRAGVTDSVATEIAQMLNDAGVNVDSAAADGGEALAAAAGDKINALRKQLQDMESVMVQYHTEAEQRSDEVATLREQLLALQGDAPPGGIMRGVQDTQADDDGEEHALGEDAAGGHGISDADLRLGLAAGGEEGALLEEDGASDVDVAEQVADDEQEEEDEFTTDATEVLGGGAKTRRSGTRRSVYEPTVASAARAQHKSKKASAAHVVGFGGTVFGGKVAEDNEAGGDGGEVSVGRRSAYSRGEGLSNLRKKANYGRRRSMGAELPQPSEVLAAVAEAASGASSAASSPAPAGGRGTTLQALIPNKMPMGNRSNSAGRGVKRGRVGAVAAAAAAAAATSPPKRARAGTAQ